jgi:hypothetical protein
MATTFTSRGWPTGATVTVYKRPVTPGAALGSSVASGTADGNGEVTFTGLTDSTHYQATDGNRTVGFRTDDAGYVPTPPPTRASRTARARRQPTSPA